MRAHGLAPISEPVRRGPYYVLHANDPRGIEVRVVVDAQFGDILSVAPARPLATVLYAALPTRGPHHPGAAELASSDKPAVTDDDAVEEVAPPARAAPRNAASRSRAAMPHPHRNGVAMHLRRRRRVRAAPC